MLDRYSLLKRYGRRFLKKHLPTRLYATLSPATMADIALRALRIGTAC
jgi:hypothetical protein